MTIDESYPIKDEGEAADSVASLEKILNLDNNDENALWHPARVHCMLGNGKQCEKLLGRLLKINSTHHNALALKSLLKVNKHGALQTFGILSIEDETNAVIGPPEMMKAHRFAYTAFPVLSLPLGATIEDVIYLLIKGNVNRFATDKGLKCVIVHMSFANTGTRHVTHQLSTKLWFFEQFQPSAFVIRFLECGHQRGINPANDKYDLIESGDLILLTPPMSMADDDRFATYYPLIKSEIAMELANWTARF